MKRGETGKVYLTPKQAARRIGVNVCTVYRWVMRGRLRAHRRAGCRYLIDPADADAVVQVVEPRGGVKGGMHEAAMRELRAAGLVE